MRGESTRTGKVLRLPEVKQITGLGRTSIYNRMSRSSKYYDPTFPAPIEIGERAMGWYEEDVRRWVAERPTRSDPRSSDAKMEPPVASVRTKRPVARNALEKDGAAVSELRSQVEAILAEIARSGVVTPLHEFNERVRAHAGLRSDVVDHLLDDIDLAAYAAYKLLPSVVLREDGGKSPLERVKRLASTIGVELSPDGVKMQRARLFLAQLRPSDRKPSDFRWISVRGGAPILTPIYEQGEMGESFRARTQEEKARSAAVKARYDNLVAPDE